MTPATPREGTTVDLTLSVPGSRPLIMKDLPFTPRRGCYYAQIGNVSGVVKVKATATRGSTVRTRTETLKLR